MLESDRVPTIIYSESIITNGDDYPHVERKQSPEMMILFLLCAILFAMFFQNGCVRETTFCSRFLSTQISRWTVRFARSFAYLARHVELRTLAGERERDTTRWQSCQRRPINLSSGCWHGDCRTELGWMARRAMRGHSRILHETVTEKLEAATAPTAPMTQEKGRREEGRVRR